MITAYDITGEEFHHTREDVDTLHKLAEMLPWRARIVNIGACFGTSSLAFVEQHLDPMVFSIDVQECPQEAANLAKAGISPGRVMRILGRSQDIGRFWPCRLDLVFVDGAHDFKSVADDIGTWRDKLRKHGIIAFHDYGAPSLPDVKRAVDEWMIKPWYEILHVGTIKAFTK